MSKFLILIYDDEANYENADAETMERIMSGHGEFARRNEGAVLGGEELQSQATATTVRPDRADDFTVADGPFAEAKEALGGFYVVEAADLDEAITLAKQVPMLGGGVEIRPIVGDDR